MEEMKKMSPEEMEKKKEEVIAMCTCVGCPSYQDCGEEIGYCFPTIGKSKCIKEEKGCICPQCPVTATMGLKNTYFCTKGSEVEQNKGKA